MSLIDGIRMRLHEVLRPSSADARSHEEISFPLDMETDRNIASGMSSEEARRQAVLAFGLVVAPRADARWAEADRAREAMAGSLVRRARAAEETRASPRPAS